MRTKTLLIAAAALVAGIISSEAQTVYSVNIAGYTSVIPPNGQFVLLANPLDNGSNTLASLFPGIPNQTTVQTWNGSGYDGYKKLAGAWKSLAAAPNNTNADNYVIPPGVGFFLNLGGANPFTNTFAGNVVGPSGNNVTNVVNPGLQLVGSLVPFSDSVSNTATVNLTVVNQTTLQVWDPTVQGFALYKYLANAWKTNGVTPQVPTIAVGQGFFLNPPTTNNLWKEVSP